MNTKDTIDILRLAADKIDDRFPGIPTSTDTAGTLGWYQGKRDGIRNAIALIELSEALRRLSCQRLSVKDENNE